MHFSLRLTAQGAGASKPDVQDLIGHEQSGTPGRSHCEATVSSWRMTGRHAICVPTLGRGHTYIFNSRTFASGGSFARTRGRCVAAVSPDHKKILPVLSAEETTAYRIPEQTRLFTLPVGENAIAFEPETNLAFIGSNASAQLTEIDVSSGKLVRTLPVAHSGDLLWTNAKLFSADRRPASRVSRTWHPTRSLASRHRKSTLASITCACHRPLPA